MGVWMASLGWLERKKAPNATKWGICGWFGSGDPKSALPVSNLNGEAGKRTRIEPFHEPTRTEGVKRLPPSPFGVEVML